MTEAEEERRERCCALVRIVLEIAFLLLKKLWAQKEPSLQTTLLCQLMRSFHYLVSVILIAFGSRLMVSLSLGEARYHAASGAAGSG